MLTPKVVVDYSIFEEKMGKIGTKVIPRARITAQYIAEYGLKAARIFTLRAGSHYNRTPGRMKIANLWQMTHSREATMDIYTISNLYPNQDIILFFEEGTKRHVIDAKPGKILHWIDSKTKEDVFAKHVDHPGMKATRMLERTEKEIINPRIKLWMEQTLAMVDRETR